jgi:hypothetical protein
MTREVTNAALFAGRHGVDVRDPAAPSLIARLELPEEDVEAIGKATHLGRFTRTETIVVNPADGTFTATLAFTAANGDQLYADAAGRFTSATGDRAEGTYVFTGGTGRFQNASGQAAFEIKPDEVGFDVTFKGTIQY